MYSKTDLCFNPISILFAGLSSRVADFSPFSWQRQTSETINKGFGQSDHLGSADDEFLERFSDVSTAIPSGATTPQPHAASQKTNLLGDFGHPIQPTITPSQVNWEMADLGFRLGQSARLQAYQDASGSRPRAIHIDATRYMLMALPSDMDSREIQSLQQAMPGQTRSERSLSESEQLSPQRKLLRQCIAEVVYWMMIAISCTLPLFLTGLNSMLSFERRHHLSERLLSSTGKMASSTAVHLVVLYNTFLRIKQGRVGLFYCLVVSWIIDTLINGFNDALSRIVLEQTSQQPNIVD